MSRSEKPESPSVLPASGTSNRDSNYTGSPETILASIDPTLYYNHGNGVYGTYSTQPAGGRESRFTEHDDAASGSSNAPATELRQTLRERQVGRFRRWRLTFTSVNMFGFNSALDFGLFLSAGQVIYTAGPGMAVIAYVLMGTLMWSTMATMGEMTALFPVKGPTFEFARRFLDESIGLAAAWMLWFSYMVTVSAEVLSITSIFQFQVDPQYLADQGYPSSTLQWDFGLDTDPSVWVGIFLVVVLLVNLLPVRQQGQIEYLFGCVKITMLVLLILFNTILNARQKFHSSRFWTYDDPYSFSSANYTVRPPNTTIDGDPTPPSVNDPGIILTGSAGTFVSLWTACVTSFYSVMGWEVILLTAPENADLAREETMKISSRKIALRVLILYALAVFTVGLNVPYTDPLLISGISHGTPDAGTVSIFILACVREHVTGLPHFLQAFFIFSATATAINGLYSSSRLLHATASLRDAWPSWGWAESVRSRLERTVYGIPMNAVVVSWFLGFLAFLSASEDSAAILERFQAVMLSSYLIVYAINCATFLVFFKEIKKAAAGMKDDELRLTPEMRTPYTRSSRQYPYRSHLQWLRALYGLVFCIITILFQGWWTFVTPMATADFVATYISIVLFIVLSAAYFLKTRGSNPRNWHIRASKLSGLEAVGPVVVRSRHRRGRLALKSEGSIWSNTKVFAEWVWVWLK